MQREGQRYIVEINGFDGSEASLSVRGADGEPLSACSAARLIRSAIATVHPLESHDAD